MASTSPEKGSTTITMPEAAWVSAIERSSSRSAMCWIASSRASTTVCALGRGPLGLGHRPAARVGVHHDLGRAPADLLLERVLDAGHAGVVEAHVAEHVGAELALRVVAAVLGEEADAVELQVAHAPGGGGVDLALDPHEGAALLQLGQQLAAAGGVEGEGAGERGGGRPGGSATSCGTA